MSNGRWRGVVAVAWGWTMVTTAAHAADGPAETAVAASPVSASVEAPAPRPLRHGVFRFHSYPAAWTAAQRSNRPILVYACSPACPGCVRMLGETYRQPAVADWVNESFETVYVDRYEQPEMVGKLHLRRFPTTIVVSPDNKVIDVIEGYVDGSAFQARLQNSLAAQQTATQAR